MRNALDAARMAATMLGPTLLEMSGIDGGEF